MGISLQPSSCFFLLLKQKLKATFSFVILFLLHVYDFQRQQPVANLLHAEQLIIVELSCILRNYIYNIFYFSSLPYGLFQDGGVPIFHVLCHYQPASQLFTLPVIQLVQT